VAAKSRANRGAGLDGQGSVDRWLQWQAHNGSSVETLGAWDPKAQPLCDTIIAVVASNRGIGFATSWDGSAVVITVYDGDAKPKWRCEDVVQLDEALSTIREAIAEMGPAPKKEWTPKR
jgi:hypothetical protein